MSEHPGLGESTDIDSAAALAADDATDTPATSDPAAYDDVELGTGDGPELAGLGGTATQPGGDG